LSIFKQTAMPPAGRQRIGGSSAATNSLLQKVSSQLSQKVVGAGSKTKGGAEDDDELGDYLKSLSRKPVTKTDLQWDKFGELSDLSEISDSATKERKKDVSTTMAANKFLKKKPADEQSTSTATVAASRPTHTTNKTATAAVNSRVGPTGSRPESSSSVLGKVQAFTSKYGSGMAGPAGVRKVTEISDSDLDMSLSTDDDVLAEIKPARGQDTRVHQPSTSVQSSTSGSMIGRQVPPEHKPSPTSIFHSSAQRHNLEDSNDDDSKSSSIGIGKSGNKFIKKRTVEPSVAHEVKDAPMTKKPTEKLVTAQLKGPTKLKNSISSTFQRPAATVPVLDSDDESLAEFMGGLSSDNNHGNRVAADAVSLRSKLSGGKM
jgi:hypothetical protein